MLYVLSVFTTDQSDVQAHRALIAAKRLREILQRCCRIIPLLCQWLQSREYWQRLYFGPSFSTLPCHLYTPH